MQVNQLTQLSIILGFGLCVEYPRDDFSRMDQNNNETTAPAAPQWQWNEIVLLESEPMLCEMERNFDDCGGGGSPCGMKNTEVAVTFAEAGFDDKGSPAAYKTFKVKSRSHFSDDGTPLVLEEFALYWRSTPGPSPGNDSILFRPESNQIVLRKYQECCGNTDSCCLPAPLENKSIPNYWRHTWLTAPDESSFKRILKALCGEDAQVGNIDATTGLYMVNKDPAAPSVGSALAAGEETSPSSPPVPTLEDESFREEKERLNALSSGNCAFWILGLVPVILFSVCITGPAFYLETSNCKFTSSALPTPSAELFNKGNTSALPNYWNTKWGAYTGPRTPLPDDPSTYQPSATAPIGNTEGGLCADSLETVVCRYARRSSKCLHVHYAGCIAWENSAAWSYFDKANVNDFSVKSSSLAESAQSMVRGYGASMAGTVIGWAGFGLIFFSLCFETSAKLIAMLDLLYYSLLLAMSAVSLYDFNLQPAALNSDQWKSVFPGCDVKLTAGPTYGLMVFNLVYLSIIVLAVFIVDLSCGAFTSATTASTEANKLDADGSAAEANKLAADASAAGGVQAGAARLPSTHHTSRAAVAKATLRAAVSVVSSVRAKNELPVLPSRSALSTPSETALLQADSVDIEMAAGPSSNAP